MGAFSFDHSVIGKTFGPYAFSYDWQKAMLYALACGAGLAARYVPPHDLSDGRRRRVRDDGGQQRPRRVDARGRDEAREQRIERP